MLRCVSVGRLKWKLGAWSPVAFGLEAEKIYEKMNTAFTGFVEAISSCVYAVLFEQH